MESLNHALFLWINASEPSAATLLIGLVLAKGLVYVFPAYLIISWLRAASEGRNALLQGVVTACVALLISWIIGKLWFHPRPFVVGLGHQYMDHKPTASFPSNHLSFIWGICAGMAIYTVRRRAASLLALIGLIVAWARIYMGVHFPFDMVGALVNAAVAGLLCLPLRNNVVPALRRCLEPVYRTVLVWPIRRGWFKP